MSSIYDTILKLITAYKKENQVHGCHVHHKEYLEWWAKKPLNKT